MQLIRHDIEVRGRDVPVYETNPSGTRSLLFLHGFARDPRDYAPLLRCLGEEHGYRVLAPFLYANGSLRGAPRSLWGAVALSEACALALHGRGALSGDYTVVGHSTGGAVAHCLAGSSPRPGAIVALNPVFPVAYGAGGFLPRGLHILARQLGGRTAPPARACGQLLLGGDRQLGNLLGAPSANLALARSLAGFELADYRRFYDARGHAGTTFQQPLRVLWAEGDEFFTPPRDLLPWLKLVFDAPSAQVLRRARGHEWPLFAPALAAAAIAA